MAASGRTPGRRPGAARTRETILGAARRCFAEDGYTGTSIRRIARDADVDHALVLHFFGTKDALFGVVLRSVPLLAGLAREAGEGAPDGLGERFVRGYLDRWEDQDAGPWLRVVVRAAAASPNAAAALASLIADEVMVLPARYVGGADAELRANLAGAQLLGVATARYVVGTEPLASAAREDVVARLAPLVQRLVTGGPTAP
ncbi:TetR family transcriptional regulator [Actinomadura chibensis]|uniref:TetR/AcrR family transcriptional regulator n=1 Tax=Actinomadura chibensis TaxID=392828 RepID=A0A5D0NIH9_9ACTN|nr:TetR family transcriptional regulator [Actinomadura chibensis]TYB44230.1 TetR/AcrR family transcriptional regulator [Actinomadura chibensis]